MKITRLRAASALLLLLAPGIARSQPAVLVRDLNTTDPQLPLFNSTRDFAVLGGVLYFANDDVTSGSELWRTDGTAAGTWIVKDVFPGSRSSNPYYLTVSNGQLFFAADGGQGRALWKTDGTAAGTVLVADPYPGSTPLSHEVGSLFDAGGVLFFVADDAVHGSELWKTDGTAAGTQLVKDILPGPNGSSPRPLAASGGLLLFAANDGSGFGAGIEPWVSDGTEAGTLPLGDLDPYGSSLPYSDTAVVRDAIAAPQGGFLFAAADDTEVPKLWYSNGTPAGTVLLKDVSYPHGLTPFNGALYFAARNDANGSELWKTDGTPAGTVLVKDLWVGGDSDPWELTVVGDRLFFYASDGPAAHGIELWTSDGTAAGTARVTDLVPGVGDAFPYFSSGNFRYHYGLSALAGHLVFLAFGPNGLQLWSSDGTAAGTVPLSPALAEAAATSEHSARVMSGRFYFRSGPLGSEIWSSDGTAAGTHRVTDGGLATSAFRLFDGKMVQKGTFAPLGNSLFFQATDGTGFQPWRSDGTPGGTAEVAALGSGGSSPDRMIPFGGGVLFQALQALWSSDGTAAGTQILSSPVNTSSPLVKLGDAAFFTTLDPGFTSSLWRTDGTAPGTFSIADLGSSSPYQVIASGGKIFLKALQSGGFFLWVSDATGPSGTYRIDGLAHGANPPFMGPLADAGGTLFFTFFEDFYGWQLWKSDGTAPGTTLVKLLQASFPTGPGELAAPAGGPLLFVNDDGQAGAELWKSDGTAGGTVRVADIRPGPLGSEPRALTAVGNRIFFSADDGVHGRELWVSDGTAAGTHLVADVLPGEGSSLPDNLTAVDNTLLFSAFDGVHGVEPWRTGGAATGTRRLQDIAPGPLSSSPIEFTAAGPNVYFAANDNTTGFELWAVPRSNVLATFSDAPTTYWAWGSVEAVAAAGITLGCGEGLFCAERTLTRAEMGVFLGRGLHGSAFVPPPATGTRFTDVPADYWAAGWIEQIATDGVTQGCAASPPRFCPAAQVSRAEMAIFLLRARHGGSYTPPPATGTRFTDVPASFWAAAWIEQLAAEGITNGCDVNLYCPNKTVGRAEMAVFLTRAFNLALP
jgi:ELWxxDGT repeat protein